MKNFFDTFGPPPGSWAAVLWVPALAGIFGAWLKLPLTDDATAMVHAVVSLLAGLYIAVCGGYSAWQVLRLIGGYRPGPAELITQVFVPVTMTAVMVWFIQRNDLGDPWLGSLAVACALAVWLAVTALMLLLLKGTQ